MHRRCRDEQHENDDPGRGKGGHAGEGSMAGEKGEGLRALLWIFLGRRQRFVSVGYLRKRTLGLGIGN